MHFSSKKLFEPAFAGIFFIGYALGQIPSNLLCVHFGAPRWLSAIMLAWGLVAAACAFMTRKWHFLVLRFVLGLAESGAYPGECTLQKVQHEP